MHYFNGIIPPKEFEEKVVGRTQWVFDYKCSARVRWMRIKPYIKNDLRYPLKKLFKSIRVSTMRRIVKS